MTYGDLHYNIPVQPKISLENMQEFQKYNYMYIIILPLQWIRLECLPSKNTAISLLLQWHNILLLVVAKNFH